MINGNFRVAGVDFVEWFNRYRLSLPRVFPYPIAKSGFGQWIKQIESLTGKETISLAEFCGHFAICYNETGGSFLPLREMGGMAYFFNHVTLSSGQTKPTYNRAPNRLAGEQLWAWGVIKDENLRKILNGNVLPLNLSPEVLAKLADCDFNKYAGWGYNQLTWLDNYRRCLQPHLPKPLDDYTTAQLNQLLVNNVDLACKAYRSYITMNRNANWAIAELGKGNFVPYGNLVSGNWTWYVNHHYLPRCQNLLAGLIHQTITDAPNPIKYAIDGLRLTPANIRAMQNYLIQTASPENKQKMMQAGGADGAWGNTTEWVFRQSGLTINELMLKI